MNTLEVSLSVAQSCFIKENTFFIEQGKWIVDKTATIITLYHAKNVGSEVILSRCEYEKPPEDNLTLLENRCDTEDDAIASALNAI